MGKAQITGAPITQTPAPVQPKSSKSGLIAGAITLVFVVAIGIGVLANVLTGKPDPSVREVATGDNKLEPVAPKLAEPIPPAAVKPPDPPVIMPTSSAPVVAKQKPVTAPIRRPARPSKARPHPSSKPGAPRPPADIGF
jgi:hypothetical protein